MEYATLNSGFKLPLVGLGTWRLTGYETILATLDTALKLGYRYFDSASAYGNEKDIQKALVGEGGLLRKHNLTRDDIIIASKLSTSDIDVAEEAIKRSVENFGGRVDLYLIHYPGKYSWPADDPRNAQVRRQAWIQLEQAKKNGLLREIGISNYSQKHIEELLSYCTVKPAVMQTERHPFLTRNDLVKYCKQNGIHFQAYSSLGSSPGDKNNQLFAHETVQRIAKKHGVTISQMLLRYSVQNEISVLPKSTSPTHLAENFDLFSFKLDESEMQELDALDRGFHFCWNPDHVV